MIVKECGPLDKKFYYFSSDTSVKYNFGQLFLPRRNRLELTANAGLGFYQVRRNRIRLLILEVALYGG